MLGDNLEKYKKFTPFKLGILRLLGIYPKVLIRPMSKNANVGSTISSRKIRNHLDVQTGEWTG